MFYDKPGWKNISQHIDKYGTKSGVFVYKNGISEDTLQKAEAKFKELEKDTPKYDMGIHNWYVDKSMKPMTELVYAWDEISKLIGPEYVLHPQPNALKVVSGNGMFIHSDSPGRDMCHILSQPDVYQTCCLLDFGVVAYFGEFEGGEVFYPRVDKKGIARDTYDEIDCFEYKPERGDIVVHSAFDQYEHGVREVTSGIRYAFSNFSLKAEDNPGTFYNYGTPEYIKQIGYAIESKTVNDEIMDNWARPLKPNPQFSPEALKEMQASGLQGRELADAFFSNLKD